MSSFRTQVKPSLFFLDCLFFLSTISYIYHIFLMSIQRQASQLLSSTASRSLRYSHRQSRHSLRYASTALPSSSVPLDEKLVRLARQTLSKAAAELNNNSANGDSNNNNDAETAKKKKHIETLREALKDWQATTDVSAGFFFFFTHYSRAWDTLWKLHTSAGFLN